VVVFLLWFRIRPSGYLFLSRSVFIRLASLVSRVFSSYATSPVLPVLLHESAARVSSISVFCSARPRIFLQRQGRSQRGLPTPLWCSQSSFPEPRPPFVRRFSHAESFGFEQHRSVSRSGIFLVVNSSVSVSCT
jgi:hypothetical protein